MTSLQFFTSWLAQAAISKTQAGFAGMRPITADQNIEDFDGFDCQGILISYSDQFGAPLDFYRIRLDTENFLKNSEMELDRKYDQPENSRPFFYFPRVKNFDWPRYLADNSRTIWITEGELKALKATILGFPCIGLGGVWNWRYRPDGDKRSASVPIPDFDEIDWQGRRVEIVFDRDPKPATRAQVHSAEQQLAHEIESHGGEVYRVQLP